MTPEAQILILNAAVLAVGYFGIYPSLREKTLAAMVRGDLIIGAAVLITAALLFAGSGIRFDMVLFQTNWLVFTLLTGMIMETPLFLWFCRRNGIDLTGGKS